METVDPCQIVYAALLAVVCVCVAAIVILDLCRDLFRDHE